MKYIDHTGKVFGWLTVLERVPVKGKKARWKCRCRCGTITYPVAQSLVLGTTKSCGCKRKSDFIKRNTKHGLYDYSGYTSWAQMMSRCHNPESKDFEHYGARGIVVCKRWHDLSKFAKDMGERPSEAHTIDRLDPNGNYEPGNCRWATPMQQGENKRNSRILVIDGERMHLRAACRKYGIAESTLNNRLNAGMTADEAVKTPVAAKNRKHEFDGKMLTAIEIAKITGLSAGAVRFRARKGIPLDLPPAVGGVFNKP